MNKKREKLNFDKTTLFLNKKTGSNLCYKK